METYLASETKNIHPHKLFVIHMGGVDLRDMRTYMVLEERAILGKFFNSFIFTSK